MGYRDDFYIVDNIIGYTGNLGSSDTPVTVYFETTEECGHITQDHDNDTNIGRELVRSVEGYGAVNTDEGTGKVRLQEYKGTKIIHFSRHEMKSVEGMCQGDKDILKMSIYTFPNVKIKYRDDLSAEDKKPWRKAK